MATLGLHVTKRGEYRGGLGRDAVTWTRHPVSPPIRKAADAVVRETMTRAHKNVLRLFRRITRRGLPFSGIAGNLQNPTIPWNTAARERCRLCTARAVSNTSPTPWGHPALAWVEDEEIETARALFPQWQTPVGANYLRSEFPGWKPRWTK